MIYGLIPLNFWQYVLVTLAVTHITIAAVTLYLHRSQAHRSVVFHPIISHFFRFWLWITTGQETKVWVAIHRKHHAKCETSEDPHSPQVFGLKTVMWQGVELYRRERANQDTMERYSQGTPTDWMERNVYTPYTSKGVLLMLAINLVLFGIPGAIIWALQMAWIPFWAAGMINGVAHYWGYRNFDCPDASMNLTPWAIIVGGEELHNNHHTYPASAKLSIKPWEFDIGWFYIRVLSVLKLAKVKRAPPVVALKADVDSVDAVTVRDLITNRFQVMTHYTKSVLLPLLRQAKASEQSKEGLKHIEKVLVRHDRFEQVHSDMIQKLDRGLAEAYQMRVRLQAIWDKTTASQKEHLEALLHWCKEAEETGCKRLHAFAQYIRQYRLKPGV